jgi:hypothetical protein
MLSCFVVHVLLLIRRRDTYLSPKTSIFALSRETFLTDMLTISPITFGGNNILDLGKVITYHPSTSLQPEGCQDSILFFINVEYVKMNSTKLTKNGQRIRVYFHPHSSNPWSIMIGRRKKFISDIFLYYQSAD